MRATGIHAEHVFRGDQMPTDIYVRFPTSLNAVRIDEGESEELEALIVRWEHLPKLSVGSVWDITDRGRVEGQGVIASIADAIETVLGEVGGVDRSLYRGYLQI